MSPSHISPNNSNYQRHPGESRDPGRKPAFKIMFKAWIPAFAGMTNFVSTITFLIFILTAFSLNVQANEEGPQSKFLEANTLFESGKTQEALQIYQDLTKLGFAGSSLFYNLGNIHYRRGERGWAILWYERAKNMAPRDGDIKFNLQLAKSHIKKVDEPVLEKIINTFTLNELGIFISVWSWVFFGVLGFLVLGKIRGEIWPVATLWTSGLLLVLFAGWFFARHSYASKNWAVLISPPGEVRNGPGEEYAVGFTIPEGSKITVLNKRPLWSQVGIPQEGLKGWIPTQELEEI